MNGIEEDNSAVWTEDLLTHAIWINLKQTHVDGINEAKQHILLVSVMIKRLFYLILIL